MEETKLTVTLPRLDVEIVRRKYPDDKAEVMTIKMTANPSFQSVGRFLMGEALSPMSLFFWATPLGVWTRMVETAWGPWLNAMAPALTGPTPSTETGPALAEPTEEANRRRQRKGPPAG